MRVVILHAHRASGTAVAIANHETWLKDLKEEHEGFYGTPHGSIAGARQSGGDVNIQTGFVDPDTALLLLLGEGYITEMACPYPDVLPNKREVLQVYKNGDPLGGWMTSGGNLTLVCGPWEYRDGRRHGLRIASATHPDDSVWYIETRCPDENPDSKDLTPNCRFDSIGG